MSGWWAGCGSRIFAHRRQPARTPGTVCVPHRDIVLSLYSRYTVCIQQIYNVYTADIWIVNTAECQIWRKIMKNELNQVQMAPFRLIFNQDGSYGVWESSGIPPGPQNRNKIKKKRCFSGFSVFSVIFPYSPIVAVCCRAAPPVPITLVLRTPIKRLINGGGTALRL